MLYKQFSKIIDKINPEFLSNFDYWLATLPTNCQENITASFVSKRMNVFYSQAEEILSLSEKIGILQKKYIVTCPNDECGAYLMVITKDELGTILLEPQYCEECNEYYQITPEDIYASYKVILQPDISEEEIGKVIERRLNQEECVSTNFRKADSLINDKSMLYEVFYNPDESAYEKFKQMKSDLDKDYGDNTTLKGKALEKLILKIFEEIKFIKGTDEIRTTTNQFDCTLLSPMVTTYPSIFNLLSPYFIVECKNEPKKSPINTYFYKILGIMQKNEAKVGIVFARRPAAKTCLDIAYNTYLQTTYASKREYLLCMDDTDLKYLVDDRVNLLEYLDFKIMKLTTDSRQAKWEMFNRNS